MGRAKGEDANGAASGGAVSSEGRCDPIAGCSPTCTSARSGTPALPHPGFAGPLGCAPGATALRSLAL